LFQRSTSSARHPRLEEMCGAESCSPLHSVERSRLLRSQHLRPIFRAINLIQEFEELLAEKRPQDPGMDGSGVKFETLEYGSEYPETMTQAIRLTEGHGRSCLCPGS